jgi:L-serine dehydratase
MALGVLDLFSIGIGPSSSHTVGPMRAAVRFVDELSSEGLLPRVERIRVGLFGSLGATGIGHGSDSAVLGGLSGLEPETLDPDSLAPLVERVRKDGRLHLGGRVTIPFDAQADLSLHLRESLPGHPNGMRISAEVDGTVIDREYYSVGGGFVVTEDEMGFEAADTRDRLHFSTADELLARCREHELSIAELMAVNERLNAHGARTPAQAAARRSGTVMRECVHNGCTRDADDPAGRTRGPAPRCPSCGRGSSTPRTYRSSGSLDALEWVNLYALGRQRGERLGRADRHRTDERGRGHHPRGAALYGPFRRRGGPPRRG